MNQEKRERNKNKAFLQELGHIKHNEIFKNQNEKIYFIKKFKLSTSFESVARL